MRCFCALCGDRKNIFGVIPTYVAVIRHQDLCVRLFSTYQLSRMAANQRVCEMPGNIVAVVVEIVQPLQQLWAMNIPIPCIPPALFLSGSTGYAFGFLTQE